MIRNMLPALIVFTLVTSATKAFAGIQVFTDEATFLSVVGPSASITFDDLTDGESINAQYTSQGVMFEGFNDGVLITSELPHSTGTLDNVSESLSLTTVPCCQGGGGFLMRFDAPASAFGLWLGDVQSVLGDTVLSLLDDSDTPVAQFATSDVIEDGPHEWRFFGVTSDTAFHGLSVAIAPADWVQFDNISVNRSVIPLPTSAWLLGGLVVTLARRRREK